MSATKRTPDTLQLKMKAVRLVGLGQVTAADQGDPETGASRYFEPRKQSGHGVEGKNTRVSCLYIRTICCFLHFKNTSCV